MDGTTAAPGWRMWLEATRPKTLWAGSAPVFLGTALAWLDGGLSWPLAGVCLLAGVSIQVGANFSNDYYDGVRGTDADRVGPTRATAAGLVSPRTMCNASYGAFAVFAAAAAILAAQAGWELLPLAALAIASAILYTGGPWPLGYNGLGDVFAFTFFGPVAVAGTHFAQTAAWSPEAALVGVAPGLFSVALLTVNNLRDVDSDRVAGKRTLAVLFGRRFARAEYTAAVLAAAAIPLLQHALYRPANVWLYLPALAPLPLALPLIAGVWQRNGETLNRSLALTGALMLLHALLYTLGLALAAPSP